MKKTLVALSFALAAATAMALPTEQQVRDEVTAGRLPQAESMMKEVVQARPGSAKAHYLYAELLARNGKFALAQEQTRSARELDSTLSFTDPEKFRAFEQLLAREQAGERGKTAGAATGSTTSARVAPESRGSAPATAAVNNAASSSPAGGIPSWVWLIAVFGVGAVLWRGFSKSRAASAAAAGMGGAGGAYAGQPGMQAGMQPGQVGVPPYGVPAGAPGYPVNNPGMMNQGMPYGAQPQQQAPTRGGGMLGTGLAVGGGLAGGMLINEMLHRRQEGQGHDAGNGNGAGDAGNQGFAGLQPQENLAANELESRPIDFGNGDGWGDNDMASGDGGGGSDDWS